MISVILCGGAGSRLWPLSRQAHPKLFVRLADGLSFLQKSFCYAVEAGAEEILAVTGRELHFQVMEEYRALNQSPALSCLLEPCGRNTAPAIAAAALETSRLHGEETLILVLAADHLIRDIPAFAKAVRAAEGLAADGRLVAFGIKPDAPETGYGYIKADGRDILEFIEKPDLPAARAYVESGQYLWNAGIFCFQAGTVLKELGRHAPAVLAAAEKSLAGARVFQTRGWRNLDLASASFAEAPNISIDYAVMEKSDRRSVVPCDIGWNDVGSWPALCALNEADADGNHLNDPGRSVLHRTENCDIYTQGRLVAAVGVRDLLIADTADALLVAAKDRTQEVKILYERLKADGHEAHRQHLTVARPWGRYTLLESAPGCKVKRLEINTGAAISLQLHRHRSEHWVVVQGMAEVDREDESHMVAAGESIYIRAGQKHRVANNGHLPLIIIEVQCGAYLEEDDIVRLQDNYGRARETHQNTESQ